MEVCRLFHNYSEHKADLYESVVINVRVSMATVSFIGSLFVIILIWLFKKYKFFSQRLILYLSISAFLSSTAYILGRVDYDPNSESKLKFCKFQGFWLLYTDWTVLMCVVCITFNLLWNVFTFIGRTDKLSIEAAYLVVSFVVTLCISCIPFIKQSFGLAGAWCWIRSKNDDCSTFYFGNVLQFVVWYGPQYFFIALLFVMYIIVIFKIRQKIKSWQGTYDPAIEQEKMLLKREVRPLLWYPTIYFAVSLFPFINRIYYSLASSPSLALYILHVLSSPLPGALTALAYSLDKDTLRRLNWASIKASLQYRSTDDVVSEYPIAVASYSGEETTDSEHEPLVTRYQSSSITGASVKKQS